VKTRIFFILVLTNIWGISGFSCELNRDQRHPITQHVQSAIKLNQERKQLYQKYFGNQAKRVFKRLILIEKLMLPPSWYFDSRAKDYLCGGVPIFSDDLVDVGLTPEFSHERILPQVDEEIYSKEQIKNRIKQLKSKVKKIKSKNLPLEDLIAEVKQLIIDSKKDIHHNCLVRHFLESIHLGLYNLPQHRLKAKSLGMRDPLDLGLDFALVQINALKFMNDLDRMADPLQKEGIPIFCQDIPPIPVP